LGRTEKVSTDVTRPTKGPRSLARARSPRRGLTALEQISAILVALIHSVIGFSGLRIFQRSLPVESDAERLGAALATARSFAIGRNGFYRVSLDMDNRIFWIDEIEDPAAPDSLVALTPKVVSPDRLDDRVVIHGVRDSGDAPLISTGTQHFVFNPDGSANRDARVFFILRADDPTIDDNFRTVRVYGPTGLNRIARGTSIAAPTASGTGGAIGVGAPKGARDSKPADEKASEHGERVKKIMSGRRGG
jgi:Tfp pilus assembly protein FimT